MKALSISNQTVTLNFFSTARTAIIFDLNYLGKLLLYKSILSQTSFFAHSPQTSLPSIVKNLPITGLLHILHVRQFGWNTFFLLLFPFSRTTPFCSTSLPHVSHVGNIFTFENIPLTFHLVSFATLWQVSQYGCFPWSKNLLSSLMLQLIHLKQSLWKSFPMAKMPPSHTFLWHLSQSSSWECPRFQH